MGALQDFREQYPQYGDLDDEVLAEQLHQRYYPDMPVPDYRAHLGLPPLPEPPKEPSIGERINAALFQRAKKADPLAAPEPVLNDDEMEAVQGWLETLRPQAELAGLSSSQLNAVQDWLRPPDPNLEQQLREDFEQNPPLPGNPLLDQVYAGWDELMAGHSTVEALDLAGRINQAQAGQPPAPDVARFGKAGFAMAALENQRMQRDPEGYVSELTAQLQEVLDARAVRRQRSQSVSYSAATRDVLAAEGFLDTEGDITAEQAFAGERGTVSAPGALSELADDPITIIAELFLRSGANMAEIIPLALAGGFTLGPFGFAGGTGAGSGMIEYRARLTEFIERAGYDLNKAEDVLAIAGNPELLREFSNQAAVEAGIIGSVDAVTGGIATKTLVPPMVKNAIAREITNVVLQTGVQAIGGGTGELGAQLYRGEGIHAGEIIAESVAEAGTAIIDVGTATLSGARQMRVERDVANAIAEIYEKLDIDPETDVETPSEPQAPDPDTEIPGFDDNTVEVQGKRYTFHVDREIPTDEGSAYDITITMPDGQEVSTTLKANEAIEDLILDLVPLYQEQEAVPEPTEPEPEPEPEPESGSEQDRIAALDYEGILDELEVAAEQMRAAFSDDSVGLDDRNLAVMTYSNLRRAAELEIENQRGPDEEQVAQYIRRHIDKIHAGLDETGPPTGPATEPPVGPSGPEIGFGDETGPPVDEPSAAVSYHDPRLRRREYRESLGSMADELLVGGDAMGQLRREEAYPGDFEANGELTGEVIERLPSENPEWFQDMVATPELKMSVKQVQAAVVKALAGKRLGVRQQRVIGTMLDTVQDVREQQVDHAREQLEQARTRRRQARQAAGLPVADNETQSGELFEEGEYDADMTADSRIIFELMEQAIRVGIDEDVLEGFSIEHQDSSDQQFIQAIEELINEHESQAGAQEVAPQPPAPTEPGVETVDGLNVGPVSDNDLQQARGEFHAVRLTGPVEIRLDDIAVDAGPLPESPTDRQISDVLVYEFDDEDGAQRIRQLAAEIEANNRIDPIVVIDRGGEYDLLEGSHRIVALRLLGKQAVPAVVAEDISEESDVDDIQVEEQGDLFGGSPKEQALADEIRRRDRARNQGQQDLETGDPGDLFSQARQQTDIEDQVPPSDEQLTDTGYFEQFGERRVDTERRINYDSLPTEELIRILYTDELTGIWNRRAFQEEGEDHAFLASIDADSMKFINDHLGHDAGDALLIAVAKALDQTDVTAYHISGDEFYLGADTRDELTAAIALAKATLSTVTLSSDRGTKRGIEITYGIGSNKAAADTAMEAQKKEREASGKRQPSGSPVAPRGFSLRIPLEPPVDMAAGTNYVGMIGRHGDLPIDANHNYVLGDGRPVRIPKKPLYRAQIISELQRRFGRKIFQGRVKGKTRLGFYRAGIGEIRIKDHNDLELVAHEVAHWFDDRFPWIRTLYRNYRQEMLGVSYDDKMIWEGYAEFMRHWFTQDYKAIAAAPAFYDAFMAALETHKKEGEAMLHLQELMHAWHLQGARARAASKQGLGKETLTERFRNLFAGLPDKLLQRTFDEIRAFKQVERAVRGGVAGPAFSGYAALRMAKGLHGVMLAIANKGSIGWNAQGDIEFVGKSLNDIFDQVKGNLEQFIQYMIGRRAQELASQGRENLYRPDEIAAMLSYAGERGNEHFPAVFDEWLQFNTEMLDFYQDSGLLSAETRAKIDEMNRNYVPFNRIADTLMEQGRVNRGGGPFVRLKGGTQNINDVMESIIGNTSHLVHMSLVNIGKRNFYNMILQQQGSIRGKRRTSGNTLAGNYAAPIPKDAVPAFIQKEQVLKAVLDGLGLSMAWYRQASAGFITDDSDIATLDVIDRMIGGMENMVMFFQTGRDPQGNIDFFFDQGEKRFFEIIDPLLYESIGRLGPQSHNLAVSIMGGFANLLRRGVVMTPTFQIKNFIRDTGNAFTLSRGKIMPIKDALVALMERVYNDEHYWLYMANGGGFASIAEAEGIDSDRIIDSPEKLLALYDRLISSFEYANRIAEFKVLMRKGSTAREAALAGREISTDFAMHGSSDALRVLTISVPFLNARMQGLYRNARELAHMPPGERIGFAGKRAFFYALRSIMTVTLPTLYLYALNKDDERYKEIPDWIRDLNWIVFTGKGEDDYMMIPKPFETGMLWGTIPERALEYYYRRDEKELADAMLWMAMQTFALDITPQIFQPWQELMQNRKFTGAPVIPQYLEGVLPQEQWRYYTSDAMIALGRRLNVSPMKAEHLVRGHFGTLGAWGLGVADYIVGDLSSGGQRPAWDPWRENILTSPFVGSGPMRRTKSEDDLYELLQETRQVATAISQMTRRNPAYIDEFLDNEAERQAYLALNAALTDSAQHMGELKRAMDLVAADPQMAPDVKRRTIDDIQRAKNEVARATREAIDPEQIRELIDQIQRRLDQRAVDERLGIAAGAQ